jgi:hypothetical protein
MLGAMAPNAPPQPNEAMARIARPTANNKILLVPCEYILLV